MNFPWTKKPVASIGTVEPGVNVIQLIEIPPYAQRIIAKGGKIELMLRDALLVSEGHYVRGITLFVNDIEKATWSAEYSR